MRRFSLNKAQARQHTVQGLLIAQANMDTVVATIRGASDGAAASQQLQGALQLSPDQVRGGVLPLLLGPAAGQAAQGRDRDSQQQPLAPAWLH